MNLETLKNQFAQEQGYTDWEQLDTLSGRKEINEHIDEICIRAQKAALEWAAKRSDVINDETTDFMWEVDRSLITNPENLIL